MKSIKQISSVNGEIKYLSPKWNVKAKVSNFEMIKQLSDKSFTKCFSVK